MTEFESALQGTGQTAREARETRAAHVNAEMAPLAAQRAGEAAAKSGTQAEALADQIQDAVQAAEAAANQRGGSVRIQGGEGGNQKIITYPDGKGGTGRIVIGEDGITVDGEPMTAMDFRNAVPTGAVDIVQSLGATLAVCVVGFPLARAFGRWLDRRGNAPKIPPEVMSRLSNIENAVETVAVEVERISEGQRFTTKLLHDRASRDLQDPLAIGDRAVR